MAIPVILPRQGQSVETCIITQWHKSKGDKVSEGDLLFSYETDKASFDEEAKASGILLEMFFIEGDEVPVLEIVAVIGNEGEETDGFRPGSAKQQEAPLSAIEAGSTASEKADIHQHLSDDSERRRISPLARRLSKEMGVAIEALKGSGPKAGSLNLISRGQPNPEL